MRQPKVDLANGYLVAEVLHKAFGAAPGAKALSPPLHKLSSSAGSKKAKLENWEAVLALCRALGFENMLPCVRFRCLTHSFPFSLSFALCLCCADFAFR